MCKNRFKRFWKELSFLVCARLMTCVDTHCLEGTLLASGHPPLYLVAKKVKLLTLHTMVASGLA